MKTTGKWWVVNEWRSGLTVSRARLTLTVVAVVVPDDEGIRIDGVLDGAAKAVT